MAEVEVGAVRVRAPDDVEIHVVQAGPMRERARRGSLSPTPEGGALLGALSAANFALAAEVEIIPTQSGTRALRRDGDTPTEIEVKVGPSESALVLIEGAGGVYAWSYPRADSLVYPGRRGPNSRTLVFPLTQTAISGAPARGRVVPSNRRGVILDWIGDKLTNAVRAYVLKFVVTAVVDTAVDYIEGDKTEGLAVLASDDPAQWRPGGAPLPMLQHDQPAKILLMIHGTFSSISGGFGHLLTNDAGRAFHSKALEAYDAVIGFDHKTLAVDPKENATALMAALQELNLPKGSTIDAVAHSRGGLVYRIFAEEILENHRPDIKLGNAVFVGCTNEGTHLAEPQNWAAMVDLYTNAIMAGVRLVAAVSGGAALSPLVSEGIKTLGRFVQMLSEVAITEKRVPGLAAMQPTSATVETLNRREGGLERLAIYYAVTSNFAAKLEPRNGITKELAEFVIDRVTNRLFKVDNDLVVDTKSMTSLGTRGKRLEAGETFTFGNTDEIYHTIYFSSDRIAHQLAKWLGFEPAFQQHLKNAQEQSSKRAKRAARPVGSSPPSMRRSFGGGTGGAIAFGTDSFRRSDTPSRALPSAAAPSRALESAPSAEAESAAAVHAAPVAAAAAPSRSLESAPSAEAESAAAAAAPAAPAESALQPEQATVTTSTPCHFAAEMEPHPPIKKPVPLFVTVAREKIEVAGHSAAVTSSVPMNIDASRKIVVEVIARKNCRVLGSSSGEMDVPEHQRPETLRFMVEGAECGAADILVEIRQGAQMLVSCLLVPVFVDSQSKTLRVSQTASISAEGTDEPAVLRIYEIMDGGRLTLRFDLTCQDPNISVSESHTLPAGFSRDAYVTDKFKEIEAAWLAAGRIYDQFLLRLKANGMRMANELLPSKVRDALWRHRDAIRAIQVISEEPFIPWELLYVTDPADPKGKGFLSEWGLVRWLHNTRWPGRRLALSSDRVNYVIPTYADPGLHLAGAAEELEVLTGLFGKSRPVQADSLSVAQFLQTDAKDCDLLHFACHGEAMQRAVMRADLLMTGSEVDGRFVEDLLTVDIVKTHARFTSTGPRPIVFINACQTGRGGTGLSIGVAGFADAFLRPYSEHGAGAVVGALWSIDDKLAIVFAQTFYAALLDGKTLVEATRSAREAAKDKEDLTWLAYTIYGDPFARVS